MYYNYHAEIKRRICNKELINWKVVDRDENFGSTLLLFFETEPMVRPIRGYRIDEYLHILEKLEIAAEGKDEGWA